MVSQRALIPHRTPPACSWQQDFFLSIKLPKILPAWESVNKKLSVMSQRALIHLQAWLQPNSPIHSPHLVSCWLCTLKLPSFSPTTQWYKQSDKTQQFCAEGLKQRAKYTLYGTMNASRSRQLSLNHGSKAQQLLHQVKIRNVRKNTLRHFEYLLLFPLCCFTLRRFKQSHVALPCTAREKPSLFCPLLYPVKQGLAAD